MKPRSSALPILVVVALTVILIVLAFLQVRWSNQVSHADRERLQTSLHTAVNRFRRDFDRELLRVCWTFDVDSGGVDPKSLQNYADRYEDWVEDSLHPALVDAVFVWKYQGRPGQRLLYLSARTGRFEPSAWPSGLTRLRARLKRDSALANPALRTAAFSGVWVLDESTPALIHAIVKSAAPGGLAASSAPRIMGALIVELNLQFIERVIFPTLAQRYFGSPGGFVYRVSIVRGANPASVLYQSSPASAGSLAVAGDAVVDLVPRQAIPPPSSLEEPVQSPNPRKSKRVLPQLITVPGAPGWRLIARHRSGSVEAAVLRLRWRNLTVSLGVLLLLALSVAIILVSAQRAHRLARLQMSLVANVSHDLRTPLAVIRSAAENLADGVVEGPQEVKEYGALIRHEDRKLSEMVEQILAFAAETSRYRTYEARPLDVAVAIESAIAAIRPLIESSGATVEKRLGPALPLVRADAAALGRCLQNLISNAVKYGGKTPWVGICAQVARAPGGTEVQIQVEDHGIGIEAEDLPYVFEPFYRGRSEHARQVRGTGLGLSLAREVAEAMNGRLTVKSAPGRGSCFTLHLPALPSAEPSEPSSNPAEIASLAADRLTRERD